jgi:hypothetical protein
MRRAGKAVATFLGLDLSAGSANLTIHINFDAGGGFEPERPIVVLTGV